MNSKTHTPLLLIKDNHGRTSILGRASDEPPSPAWLAMQSKPFSKNAVF